MIGVDLFDAYPEPTQKRTLMEAYNLQDTAPKKKGKKP